MKRRRQSGNNAQLWMCLVVKVKSDAVKSDIAQEPGILGSWIKVNWKWSNRRWQEWMNINILEISELKWTRMGKFHSDDHYIYYCGQESLRRNGVALIVNKRIQNALFGCNIKTKEWCLHFQGKPFNITIIKVYASTINVTNAKEAEVEWFNEDLSDLLELTPKKKMSFSL